MPSLVVSQTIVSSQVIKLNFNIRLLSTSLINVAMNRSVSAAMLLVTLEEDSILNGLYSSEQEFRFKKSLAECLVTSY